MRKIRQNVLLLGLLVAGAPGTRAQTGESLALTISSLRMAAQATRSTTFNMGGLTTQSSSSANSGKQGASPHILQRSGPPPNDVNRKEFEDNAGAGAGKLMIRSMPSGADVFVDGLLVGQTPMLMVIAPGPHKVDMRGARDDSGHASVQVMAKVTRTVAVELKQRYPSSILLR
jgi:hypothetical protein